MALSEEKPKGEGPADAPSWSQMGLRQKIKHLYSNISVEPPLLLYIVPSLLSSITIENMYLEKACRVSLNYNEGVCDSVTKRNVTNETEAFQVEVSETVAGMLVWQSALGTVFPIALVLCAGSWSDRRRRRKPLILFPLFGDVLMRVGLLLSTVFFYEVSLEMTAVIEVIFPALTGGGTVFILAICSYVGDITSPEKRTFRLGMVWAVLSWVNPIGTALSGVGHAALGFTGMFAVGIAFNLLGIAYAHLYLPEPRAPIPRPEGVSFVSDFFNWRHVWDTMRVGLKSGAGSYRLQFLLVVILHIVTVGPQSGEGVVSFLYVTTRFKWDDITVSTFTTYIVILNAVGKFPQQVLCIFKEMSLYSICHLRTVKWSFPSCFLIFCYVFCVTRVRARN
ncbi:hypothetical protein ONE63_003616 [Megalurothrips usitatus]|uniref:Proton-coupled folate transporter-like n=1 Tax=Megalurothrips usitatus TaxID=439358 RepID=A0AAV7X628_9NEOP|nr:hypothetical protein ONE63_003616 [Megalurothrips usitatus]